MDRGSSSGFALAGFKARAPSPRLPADTLVRLFRRADLPHLFGSDLFTRRTLRLAWHLTSVARLGFGFWVRSSAGLIPPTTLVSFVPTAEVTQWLKHYRPAPAGGIR